MAIIDGGELRVYIGGDPIAYATSSTINLTAQVDQLAPTSVSDAPFTVIKPRRKSGNISTNSLYGTGSNYDFKQMFDAWNNGTQLTIAFKSPNSGEWQVSSSAYITSLSATGAVSEDSSLRATIQFSGAITISTNA